MKASRTLVSFLFLLITLMTFPNKGEAHYNWTTHEDLSFGPPTFYGEVDPPQIKMDGLGNVFVAWTSQEILGRVIKVTRFDAASKQWSFPKRVGLNHAENPRLAVTKDGKAIVVWKKIQEGKGIIHYTIFQNTWGSEAAIDLLDLSDQDHPNVAVDELGNAFIVWQATTIPTSDHLLASVIRSTIYHFQTSTFEPIVNLSTDYSLIDQCYVGQPQVAVNAMGKAVALWRYNDGGTTPDPFRIQANTYSLGSWDKEENVKTSPTAQLLLPLVFVSPSGDVMAIWVQTGMHYYSVAAAIKKQEWSSSVALSEIGYLISGTYCEKKPLADGGFDDQGNAVVVWTLIDESAAIPHSIVQAKTFQNSTWSNPTTLFESSTARGSAKIAVDNTGNACVIFVSERFPFNLIKNPIAIQTARFSKEFNAWFLPDQLSTENNNFLPNISVDGNGNFCAIWIAHKHQFNIVQSSRMLKFLPSLPEPPQRVIIHPPINVKGYQTKNQFASQIERVNTITWEAPQGHPRPVSYSIYRDKEMKNLLTNVEAHKKLEFRDFNRKKKIYTYYIVSVNADNQVSEIVVVEIPPIK